MPLSIRSLHSHCRLSKEPFGRCFRRCSRQATTFLVRLSHTAECLCGASSTMSDAVPLSAGVASLCTLGRNAQQKTVLVANSGNPKRSARSMTWRTDLSVNKRRSVDAFEAIPLICLCRRPLLPNFKDASSQSSPCWMHAQSHRKLEM